jgi:hypothetical protein
MNTTATATAIQIQGIPTASPFAVFNGRTGHVVETRTHGVVRVRLAQPVSTEDARLAEVQHVGWLTEDPQRFEIDVLAKYLTDAPIVEPGREVPMAIVDAAFAEIGAAYRQANRAPVAATIALRSEAFRSVEFWGMVRETVTRRMLDSLIPESVATAEDARAWVYDYAAREAFGF